MREGLDMMKLCQVIWHSLKLLKFAPVRVAVCLHLPSDSIA